MENTTLPTIINSESERIHSNNTKLFYFQIFIITVIIFTCIVNLSLKTGNMNLWIALMSSCIGYVLPNPKIPNGLVFQKK